MESLYKYKRDLINLGTSQIQKKILENSFARWYINCEKIYVFPIKNIVLQHDLNYANKYNAAKFNIDYVMEKSEHIFEAFLKHLNSTFNIQTDYAHKILFSSTEQTIHKSITKKQLNRLKKIYKGPNSVFQQMVHNLLSLYNFLGINNLQLAIPPLFKGVELFGSPLNTHNDEYCSLFEIEKQFGSLGSFWKYKFHRNGVYLCNPPFDETLINRMAKKIICDINSTKYKVLVIITIPVWDSHSQKECKVKNFNLELEGLKNLLNSAFVKESHILDKNKFPYWDHFTEKCISVCWTHLIILSNLNDIFYKKNFHINNIIEPWSKFH